MLKFLILYSREMSGRRTRCWKLLISLFKEFFSLIVMNEVYNVETGLRKPADVMTIAYAVKSHYKLNISIEERKNTIGKYI
ncbi:hypothetical protein NCCP2331_30960 [Sporosarcina sp. NCCP-2331]|nr:hypothetical protein NCCP2331_30960 [Sporosarcina sp. NCCP-2331]